ncbi:serine O-acetyltransferase EpsC [Taklimakanibacter deserti]|uniref:serine O-acetyltransferase EpsC n=1 Tax=Taklimakanibacter deserti TaxID=2267839 RepID=UPI0034D62929
MTAQIQTLKPAGAPEQSWDLDAIVEELRLSREVADNIRHRGEVRELPSRAAVAGILDDLAAALFPTHYGRTVLTDESIDYFVGSSLERALTSLKEQVRRGLHFTADADPPVDDPEAKALEIIRCFAHRLPALRALLVSDFRAALRGDPAATSIAEILLCYRGVTAIIHHRLAHALHRLGARLVARLIADIAHSATGIDIHPGAEIGESFFIDHGTGVVIGETAIIGSHVRLYQAVTLGAKRFPVAADGSLLKGAPRHPIIEDNVVIYAGATILGRITVGRDSVIGGNVWLTHSVPPGSIVTQAEAQNE